MCSHRHKGSDSEGGRLGETSLGFHSFLHGYLRACCSHRKEPSKSPVLPRPAPQPHQSPPSASALSFWLDLGVAPRLPTAGAGSEGLHQQPSMRECMSSKTQWERSSQSRTSVVFLATNRMRSCLSLIGHSWGKARDGSTGCNPGRTPGSRTKPRPQSASHRRRYKASTHTRSKNARLLWTEQPRGGWKSSFRSSGGLSGQEHVYSVFLVATTNRVSISACGVRQTCSLQNTNPGRRIPEYGPGRWKEHLHLPL